MPIVLFLLHLFACDEEICARGCDHIVAAVGRWVPDGFMLAHKQDGDSGCEAAERWSAGGGEGDVMPGSGVGKACLGGEGLAAV